MRRSRQLFLAITLAIGATACDESLSTVTSPTPDLEPTFSSIQKYIFESTDSSGRTACIHCHTNLGTPPAGGLNLLHDVAYDQLVNFSSTEIPSLKRVNPGNPNDSYLIHKMEGRAGIVGSRMPFDGPPYLTDSQIQVVKRWIELGALRN